MTTYSGMRKQTFNGMIERLHKFFRRVNRPDEETRTMWYESVKFIPEQAVPTIEIEIQVTRDSLPSNLPKAIKAGWMTYISKHPEKIRQYEQTNCDECHGIGFVYGRKAYKDTSTYYTPAFRCAKCDNWQRHVGSRIAASMPLATKDDMRLMGFEPVSVTMPNHNR